MDEEGKGVPPECASRWPSDPALQLLAESLCQIFTTQYSGTVGLSQRKQYAIALRHVTAFLEKNDFPPFVVGCFKDLILDIRELDSGQVADFLTPVRARHRPVDARDIWRAKTFAAIALNVLAEDSRGHLKEQAKRVAKGYKRLFPDEKKVTLAAVRQWRNRFNNGKIKDRSAQLLFNNRAAVIKIAQDDLIEKGVKSTACAVSEIVLSFAAAQKPPAAG